ncbi:hypothetical protein F8M41_019882 [Gigaspora margarita]|uniref:Uncharacterized protein n=1 Tax=Gigaspora margarita TaxID=4874 RepID=A0A8H4EK23_GIGMA|nr:hypothetical protein F8M41_019882 [Gigaspora margarita]
MSVCKYNELDFGFEIERQFLGFTFDPLFATIPLNIIFVFVRKYDFAPQKTLQTYHTRINGTYVPMIRIDIGSEANVSRI